MTLDDSELSLNILRATSYSSTRKGRAESWGQWWYVWQTCRCSKSPRSLWSTDGIEEVEGSSEDPRSGKSDVYRVWIEEMTMGNKRRQISSRGIWTSRRKVPVVWVSRSNWGIHKHTQHAARIMVLQPDNLRTTAGKEFSQIQMWSHAPTLQAQGDLRGFQRWLGPIRGDGFWMLVDCACWIVNKWIQLFIMNLLYTDWLRSKTWKMFLLLTTSTSNTLHRQTEFNLPCQWLPITDRVDLIFEMCW